jgi:hypothetical protein
MDKGVPFPFQNDYLVLILSLYSVPKSNGKYYFSLCNRDLFSCVDFSLGSNLSTYYYGTK